VNENAFESLDVEGTGLSVHAQIALRLTRRVYATGRIQWLSVGRSTNVSLIYSNMSLGLRAYLPRPAEWPALFAEAGVARADVFHQPSGFSLSDGVGAQVAVGTQWGVRDVPPIALDLALEHVRAGSDPVLGGTTLRVGFVLLERRSPEEEEREREGWEPRRPPASDE